MTNSLKFILNSQMKGYQLAQKKEKGGFTLIELLVAMIMAALIITPLLGFMINILDSDRREQAKANSEQEIKAALDYISQDMEQAAYVYDAAGLRAIQAQLPTSCGLPSCEPVLVFWKRKFLDKNQTIPNTALVNRSQSIGQVNNGNDAFVYSLVAYYLIQDNNSTWSKAARIGRFEINDGIRAVGTTPGAATATRTETDTVTNSNIPVDYVMYPDNGYKSFNLSLQGDLNAKMNQWQKYASQPYTDEANPIQILTDYIDPSSPEPPAPPTTCPTTGQQLIPGSTAPQYNQGRTRGFYVCVNNTDPSKISVQVNIRGNAFARLQNNNVNYDNKPSPYFPTVSSDIKGRGFLYTK